MAGSAALAPKSRLHCPCGKYLHAEDSEALVHLAQAHLAADHPHLVEAYDREDILWMAY
ncbi:hypothetical protein [Microbacterium sp. CIAB417]|uniref:hypothetical protein n=1 Tax=Microbacterium sp. CIAB417 TaxID=2860287 RepID=UPI001FACFD02|nr:hypothetical protein [Microbacterium sp. CIAB417]